VCASDRGWRPTVRVGCSVRDAPDWLRTSQATTDVTQMTQMTQGRSECARPIADGVPGFVSVEPTMTPLRRRMIDDTVRAQHNRCELAAA
jgi:hypothetical protein